MAPWCGARTSRILLVTALAAGLAVLAPAACLAGGGRSSPADPVFTRYISGLRAGRTPQTLGLAPAPVSRTGVPRAHYAPLMARFPERFAPADAADTPRATAASGGGATGTDGTAAYDLRAGGRVTPIRDQGRWGTCWAFASLASLESGLLPDEAPDFSENNMVNRAGYALGYDGGGNSYMAAAYLARWDGPVAEADDPYAPYAGTPASSPPRAEVGEHVHEVLMLPARTGAADNADLKWAVLNRGAVYTTMYWTATAYRDATAAYYSRSSGANHAVALVGWDDAVPASRFATAPAGPGAFLVRNSWGEGFGSGGYFWVSYYDTSFAGQSAVFGGAEPASPAERIYQHDTLGWITSYRPPGATDSSTAWFAAVYTPAETGSLTAAGFYATAPNAAYEVRVADSVDGIRDAAALASGTLAVPGYHTVPLAEPVPVTAGRLVVVAVRVSVPGYRFPVAIERPYAGYADATAGAGQSYVSGDGATWTDMTKLIAGTDVCLKGYGLATAQPSPNPTPTPDPTATPDTDEDPAPDPGEAVAPTLWIGGVTCRPGAVVRIAFRVGHPDALSGADVRFILRTRRGAVVRRVTLRDVSDAGPNAWRVRAPARRGTYVVVAVATLDAGGASKPATAKLRVR